MGCQAYFSTGTKATVLDTDDKISILPLPHPTEGIVNSSKEGVLKTQTFKATMYEAT